MAAIDTQIPRMLPTQKPATVSTELIGHRTCPLCEATCGLSVYRRKDTAGDEHWLIRGDADDPFSQGFICPKGTALGALHDDPNRLRTPLRRVGDDPATATYEPIGWEEALEEVNTALGAIIAEHGTDSIGIYLGNPVVHSHHLSLFTGALVRAVNSHHLYTASTVDQMARHVSSGMLFGDPDAIAVPDLDRTDYLLMLGANPVESNGSLCTAPNFEGRLQALRDRGGTLIVVDPRRTKTAELASEHVAIIPGTDALLLAALVAEVLNRGAIDAGVAAAYEPELKELQAALAGFDPDTVASATGIDAATIRRIAHEFAAAPSAVAYSRIGAHTTIFGTLASWLTDVLTIITGNLDRPGGAMFPTPLHLGVGSGTGRGFRTGRWSSRVHGRPEVRGEAPAAEMATEITTPGPGQMRAMIVVAGNPVLSTPDAATLDEALGQLNFLVSVDPWLNETSRRATIILPPPSAMQRSHYDIGFSRLSVRNVAKWSPALLEADDHPPEWWIICALIGIVSGLGPTAAEPVCEQLIERACSRLASATGSDAAALRDQIKVPGRSPADQLVDLLLRGSDRSDLTLDDLIDAPHGLDLGALEPALSEILRTPDGRIDLFPDALRADLARLVERCERGAASDQLLLVGRRDLRSNNSWLHNAAVLVRGKDRCTLVVHPRDAAAHGLVDGDAAIVVSAAGEIVAPVEIDDTIRPGVVSLPHGYGHNLAGARLDVAAQRPGVNSNVLTDGTQIDPLCGTAQLNAIPVTIGPAQPIPGVG